MARKKKDRADELIDEMLKDREPEEILGESGSCCGFNVFDMFHVPNIAFKGTALYPQIRIYPACPEQTTVRRRVQPCDTA